MCTDCLNYWRLGFEYGWGKYFPIASHQERFWCALGTKCYVIENSLLWDAEVRETNRLSHSSNVAVKNIWRCASTSICVFMVQYLILQWRWCLNDRYTPRQMGINLIAALNTYTAVLCTEAGIEELKEAPACSSTTVAVFFPAALSILEHLPRGFEFLRGQMFICSLLCISCFCLYLQVWRWTDSLSKKTQ